MEKYGVQQKQKTKPTEQVKTGSDVGTANRVVCPVCHTEAQWHGVWKCPNCGTAPWEPKK